MSRQKVFLVLVLICGLVDSSLLVGRLIAVQPFARIATYLSLLIGIGLAVFIFKGIWGRVTNDNL